MPCVLCVPCALCFYGGHERQLLVDRVSEKDLLLHVLAATYDLNVDWETQAPAASIAGVDSPSLAEGVDNQEGQHLSEL